MAMISERIARLRRERGLTQEQLGQLVGVSAQAVSKWEKGGAPDVELLPALADRLGVSIDALFGRDEGQSLNVPRMLGRWLTAFPAEKRMEALFRLLCREFEYLGSSREFNVTDIQKSCYMQVSGPAGDETVWIRSIVLTDEGMSMGIFAEDFPFYLLLPEPAKGYEANLRDNEDYRRLFRALSRPGCLEVLRYLDGKKRKRLITISAVAKSTGLSQTAAEEAIKALAECSLLDKREIEVESGCEEVYFLNDQGALVPFLYLAQWLLEKDETWYFGWETRKRPILEPKKKEKVYEETN